jgi:hypothetical protein
MWNDFLFQVQKPRDLASVNRGRRILAEISAPDAFCVPYFLLTFATMARTYLHS